MKKIAVILLVTCGLVFAGLAEAAPKKRTRLQNRVGPYGTGQVGMTSYTSDQSVTEQDLLNLISSTSVPSQNIRVSTDDSNPGFNLAFGYRFNRFVALELGIIEYGKLSSQASGEFDFPNDNSGYIKDTIEIAFHIGGPLISTIGILPLSEKFELFARAGYLFASVEREFSERIAGQNGIHASARGDTQHLIIGLGVNWNINQVYTVRAEYQKLNDAGQKNLTGTEDLNFLSVGMAVRF
jgi:opacity protein-like surface antigen